mmetsp:Transcript_7184/g.12091  ORF Transcript_7184/g.12091 Transcript_7184/m.12091 type:complete len:205 (-) Transcript_7184:1328-1942(-)
MALHGLHGEGHATEVSQVFPHGEVPIHLVLCAVLGVDVNVFLSLLLHELCLGLEELGILLLPPVGDVAAVVELTALIVVAVGDLMGNHRPYRTEVDGLEVLGPTPNVEAKLDVADGLMVEGWLKDRCWEYDLIVQRVKVGVDLVGVHLPLCFVLGSVQFLIELCLQLKLGHFLPQRQNVVSLLESECCMVFPLVRKPNLRRELR